LEVWKDGRSDAILPPPFHPSSHSFIEDMGFFKSLFGAIDPGGRLGLDELARRLGHPPDALRAFTPAYREFVIPKRSGGARRISAPDDPTRDLQRRILRRLLARLKAHPAAMGFERGRSIVTNALPHAGKAVVIRMDVKDFFPSTTADRVGAYFRKTGWNADAADVLTRLCTHRKGLPQGAPTSPRLSNLVNFGLDARLDGLAKSLEAVYTRYADDLTFSFEEDRPELNRALIRIAKLILADVGYTLHTRPKLRLMRRHERQLVTGLVVNAKVQLPRMRRRWLRAVEHRAARGKPLTLSLPTLGGWVALQDMIETQRGSGA
jgi:retron-type reverse transcriptase